MDDPTLQPRDDLIAAVDELRGLVKLSVVSSLIVIAALGSYLVWQNRNVRRESANQHVLIQELDRQQRALNDIASRFQQYAGTNPAFVPLIQKIGLEPAGVGDARLPSNPAPRAAQPR